MISIYLLSKVVLISGLPQPVSCSGTGQVTNRMQRDNPDIHTRQTEGRNDEGSCAISRSSTPAGSRGEARLVVPNHPTILTGAVWSTYGLLGKHCREGHGPYTVESGADPVDDFIARHQVR